MVSEKEAEISSFLWEELDSRPKSGGGVRRGGRRPLLAQGL